MKAKYQYKDYIAKVEYDEMAEVLCGTVVNMSKDIVLFEREPKESETIEKKEDNGVQIVLFSLMTIVLIISLFFTWTLENKLKKC